MSRSADTKHNQVADPEEMEVLKKYGTIINLPHKKSATRAHMTLSNRAAQFAPFAALTGYDASIREAAKANAEKGKDATIEDDIGY